jgi:hypothetical protein
VDINMSTQDTSDGFFGSIWDNVLAPIGGGILDLVYDEDEGGVQWGNILPILAGVGTAEGWFGDNNQPNVGYQGGIPRYKAMRRTVPQYYGHPDRMPGEYGQRYFTNTQFVPQGDGAAMSAAADQINQEANTLAQKNRDQSAKIAPLIDRMKKQGFAGGGIASLGRYMNGATDGMGDHIPAMIGGMQPAAMSDGEYVVPADVVSHLGNGNSNAGAQQLERMMQRVRNARTGSPTQGRKINPSTYLPR